MLKMAIICISSSGKEKLLRCKVGFAHTPSELTSGGMEMQNSFVSMLEFIFRPSARQRQRQRHKQRQKQRANV
jgi:hypothetical protein